MEQSHSLADRGQRLQRIIGDLPLAEQSQLVKAVRLSESGFSRLQTSASIYVWHSLSQAFPERNFALSSTVLEDYSAEIMALPNRTPNGLLLPRRETFLSFNLVQQALAATIVSLNLERDFVAFQSPCNVRIVSGTADAKIDSRPYASSKIHSDVWYGEPLSSILFNLPLLGDPSVVTMEFFELGAFPADLQKRLADFSEGHRAVAQAKRAPVGFDLGVLYVSDSLSLHQTVRHGAGMRLSLDWRAIPREKAQNETDETIGSGAIYVPTERFLKGGSTLVFADGDPLDAFVRRSRGEVVDRSRIEIVSTESA